MPEDCLRGRMTWQTLMLTRAGTVKSDMKNRAHARHPVQHDCWASRVKPRARTRRSGLEEAQELARSSHSFGSFE